ncbi:MAG: aminoacyl-tRNA hydrolase [Candidatus Magasanikbacteria bacterium]|nr:aminoacyl-tRNA hydrolase [Candidatus Magasanikbacteria bacterium]
MIPYDEIHLDFVRASGPGGQNVNKTATKAQLRWRVGVSRAFSSQEKERIRARLQNRINNNDEVVLSSSAERSQAQNKTTVVKQLQLLVRRALVIPKKRAATRPTRAAKARRLETKKHISALKELRKQVSYGHHI